MRSKPSPNVRNTHAKKRLIVKEAISTRGAANKPPPVDKSRNFDLLHQSPSRASNTSSSFGSDTRYNTLGTTSSSIASPLRRSPRKSTPKRRSAAKTTANENLPRRRKRRNHVLRDIRNLQKSFYHLIPKSSFQRVIREIMQQYGAGDAWRISSQALSALQESAESYITQFMEDSYACTLHRNRITLAPKDMSLVKFLRGVRDSGHE